MSNRSDRIHGKDSTPTARPRKKLSLKSRSWDLLRNLFGSLRAFISVAQSPVVRHTFKRFAKRIAALTAAHFVIGNPTMYPIRAALFGMSLLSLGSIKLDPKMFETSSLHSISTMTLSYSVLRVALLECFLDTFRQLEPTEAQQLATVKPQFKKTFKDKVMRAMFGGQPDNMQKAIETVALGWTLKLWRKLPVGGHIVAPFAQFASSSRLMGSRVLAGAVTAAALYPGWEHYAMEVVQVWASAKILSEQCLDYFLVRHIHPQQRVAFLTDNQMILVGYLFLPTALSRLPIVGPLAMIPAYALAAWALHAILARQGANNVYLKYGTKPGQLGGPPAGSVGHVLSPAGAAAPGLSAAGGGAGLPGSHGIPPTAMYHIPHGDVSAAGLPSAPPMPTTPLPQDPLNATYEGITPSGDVGQQQGLYPNITALKDGRHGPNTPSPLTRRNVG